MNLPEMKPNNLVLLVVTSLIILGLIVLAAIFGLIPRFLSGEEFALYHHANNYDHFTAWRTYFHEVGRPVATGWWIYSYELFGYNPLLLHLSSFLLLFLAAFTGSLLFCRTWPNSHKYFYTSALLLILFFFNWNSISMPFRAGNDQRHLVLIFFFIAGLCLQEWASKQSRKGVWFTLSLLFFLIAVFTYESVVFLFPVLLLLSWPLEKRGNMKTYFLLGLGSLFVIALPYLVYQTWGLITEDFTFRASLTSPLDPVHLVRYFQMLVNYGGTANFFLPISTTTASIIYLGTLVISVNMLRSNLAKGGNLHTVSITLASLWLLSVGLVIFAYAGYQESTRVYSAAIFGLSPLVLLSAQSTPSKWIRSIASVLVLVSVLLGFAQFINLAVERAALESERNAFYLGMKQIVPSVKSGTVFIFIDHPQSNDGCGPSFEMLYNRTDIRCAFFSSSIAEYHAVRYSDHIHANRGGNLWTENWIIIKINDQGKPEIVPEIEEGDFDLLLSWNNKEPIRTDYRRIENDQNISPSDMFLDLQKRHNLLLLR